jgi:hypothetical protein
MRKEMKGVLIRYQEAYLGFPRFGFGFKGVMLLRVVPDSGVAIDGYFMKYSVEPNAVSMIWGVADIIK